MKTFSVKPLTVFKSDNDQYVTSLGHDITNIVLDELKLSEAPVQGADDDNEMLAVQNAVVKYITDKKLTNLAERKEFSMHIDPILFPTQYTELKNTKLQQLSSVFQFDDANNKIILRNSTLEIAIYKFSMLMQNVLGDEAPPLKEMKTLLEIDVIPNTKAKNLLNL